MKKETKRNEKIYGYRMKVLIILNFSLQAQYLRKFLLLSYGKKKSLNQSECKIL